MRKSNKANLPTTAFSPQLRSHSGDRGDFCQEHLPQFDYEGGPFANGSANEINPESLTHINKLNVAEAHSAALSQSDDKLSPIGHELGGHRERLRQRFAKGGAAALADYELLEMLLFASNPRGDVKPLAKNLIRHFGSFAAVIAAPRKELLAISGIGEVALTMIKLVEAAALELSKERVIKREVLSNWRALLDYCRSAMAYQRTEQFRILFLDNKNALIADEVQQTGTLNYAPVYPREVVKRCLELGASAIILLHNHPSGDPEPSKADIDMTHEIIEAVKVVGVAVHDHLIIGLSGHTSLKSLGVI